MPSYNPNEWDLYATLWEKRSWMVRRVDRVSVVDRDRLQLSITFTIDNRAVRDQLKAHGFLRDQPQQVPLPLFLWKKEPVLDVDVRNDSGRRLPVATRDEATYYAQCILMSQAKIEALATRGGETQFAPFSSSLNSFLAKDTYGVPVDLYKQVIKTFLEADEKQLTAQEQDQLAYFQYWRRVLRDSPHRELIHTFLHSYIFLARVDLDPTVDVQVIHCRFVYKNEFRLDRPRFGRATYHYDVLATGFDSLDERVHVRLEAPAGTRILEVEPLIQTRIQDEKSQETARGLLKAVLTSSMVELVRDKSVYRNCRRADRLAISLRLTFMPRRSTFITPSFFLSLAYIGCLIAVLSLLWFHEEATSPFTGVMGLLAIGAAFLTRDLQHDIASQVSERSRWSFGIASALVFISSFLVGIKATSGFLYYLTIAITVIAFIFSSIYALSTGASLHRMRRKIAAGCQLR